MENLNILQVTAGLEEGGVERGTLEMAEFIIKKDAKSFVASGGGRLVTHLEDLGVKHFRLPLNKRDPISIIFSAFRLRKIINDNQVSLVHARSRAPAWAAYIACNLTRTPFVTTFHGTHQSQNSVKKIYNSSMVRGRRVIAISNFIKQHLIDNYNVDPLLIDLAPRGFSPLIFDPDAIGVEEPKKLRKTLNIDASDIVISLPGRLTRWKGQVEFIQALSTIKDYPNWKALLIGGEGKKKAYKNELQQLCDDCSLHDRVLMVGSQSNMPLFYAISDVVVSNSLEPEAFGRVAVEAQAMMTPVIATAHGGSLETVLDGESGWLVPPGDVESLSSTLRLILSEKYDLHKMGLKGREWVLRSYTTDMTCMSEWHSYQKILRGLE